VDADLRDFFGSVDHEKLLTLVSQRVADGRVLRLIKAMLKAGRLGLWGSRFEAISAFTFVTAR
jgi:RNA-directed DNA polymerase